LDKPRPIIGVVGSHFERRDRGMVSGCPPSYLAAIEAAGGIPMIIHLTRDAEVLAALYSRCDGILFVGGDDVDPAHYGAAPHPHLGVVEPLRDEVELALARRAAAEALPTLGICRGIQLLNVALGGTLYQDIPSELAGAADHRESALRGERAYLAHSIAIEPDSWLAAQLGATETLVNTLHHQALRDVAPGLRVVARAPDGVIEAVEGAGPGFLAAVQCHPENLWPEADRRWAQFFATFVEIARDRAHREVWRA
jgi:putative glutamine amidotransferase